MLTTVKTRYVQRRNGSRHTKARASRTGLPSRGAGSGVRISEVRRKNNEASTARYDTAFPAKSTAVPRGPMRRAARAGPTMRDEVITEVFRDMTLLISSGSTSSVTRPRRDGLSMALAMPSTSESAYTTGRLACPVASKIASSTA